MAYWSIIETNVTVFCACIVAIKPALKYLFPEKLLSSTRSGWSRFLSSRSGRSTDNISKEKSSEYSSGSFERIKDRPPHLPLYNESADRFGSTKLNDEHVVPLSAIFVGRSDSWWFLTSLNFNYQCVIGVLKYVHSPDLRVFFFVASFKKKKHTVFIGMLRLYI